MFRVVQPSIDLAKLVRGYFGCSGGGMATLNIV